MRYPFMAAANDFLDAYSGVYSEAMLCELHRRYPKIARQLNKLYAEKRISTTNPRDLKPDDIREYARFLRLRGLKPTSITKDVSSISVLCMYTSGNNCVDVARIRYPMLFPKNKNVRLPITERAEFNRILKFASKLTKESDIYRIRCYAECLFAFGTGSRTIELKNAKTRHLSDDLHFMFFDVVKGSATYGEVRTVPVRPEVREIIQLYLTTREMRSQFLFPNKNGEKMSTNSFTKDRNLVIIETNVTFDFRKCRRTYAQYLIDEGFPVDKVAVVLGHSNSKTTEKSYARPRDDRVVREIDTKWNSETND